MASIQNLASGVLASDISSSATSLSVNCGEGSSSTLTAVWPSAPFYITVMPAYPTLGVANSLNSEIMLVSALSASDNVVTMTVSRGQRGTTAKTFSEGAIVTNGIYTADMDYAQAVGKSFFSATLTNSITGSYTVSDSMLPNTPEDGMSIRVVFGGVREDPTATPKLRLNSGSYYNIYAGNNLSSNVGDTTTKAMVKSGVIYELTYYNGAWYVLNLVASSSITSDNVDWATIGWRPLVCQSGLSGTRVGASFDATGATMLKATIVAQMSAQSWLDFRVYDNNFGNKWSSTWRTMVTGVTHEQSTVTSGWGTVAYLNNTPRTVNALALLTATLARATPTSKWTAQSILSAEAWSTQIASNEIGSNINQLSMALVSGVNLTGNISVVGFFPS